MEKRPHFKATLTYLSTEDGGIVTPVSSGFRAIIRFPYDNRELIVNQTFLETDIVFPGDTVIADMFLLDAKETLEKIYTGLGFDLLIQSNIIANGVVTHIYRMNDNK
ncbi:hypothetical protein SAMN05421856_102184 [Chryseobacterium taichungense]|uniref:Elongation factor Tu n=1 Tax=Chryseobacterium taichungense TaxID=295069 RepID=A0A1H7X350_9FLAO|nr:hypothetical protein [Chryseobacterium taichungense]SEM28286.1 hypothetical protein SAMN05421856_102184 [Chryseobacterium taichungense]